jgi:integrase/recombinase XerD
LTSDIQKVEQNKKSQSLESIVNHWLSDRSVLSGRQYAGEWLRFAKWWRERAGSENPFVGVTVADARDYAAHLRSKASPATVSRALSALSSLWRSAAAELAVHGISVQNPWSPGSTPRPRVRDRMPERVLTEDEVRRLIDACESLEEVAVVTLLYHTGLRAAEACSATWGNLRQTRRGWRLTVAGKGNKTRVVGLSDDDVLLLETLRRDRSDALIPGGKDGHMSERQCHRIVARVASRAGLRTPSRNVSPHWLRHAAASHALDRGASPVAVQHALGHASLATTSRYLHANPDDVLADYLVGDPPVRRSGSAGDRRAGGVPLGDGIDQGGDLRQQHRGGQAHRGSRAGR